MKDYEKKFEEFWKELVCDQDGLLIPDKVKRELFDYSNLMKNASTVYEIVTGGAISKPETDIDHVLGEFERVVAEMNIVKEKPNTVDREHDEEPNNYPQKPFED